MAFVWVGNITADTGEVKATVLTEIQDNCDTVDDNKCTTDSVGYQNNDNAPYDSGDYAVDKADKTGVDTGHNSPYCYDYAVDKADKTGVDTGYNSPYCYNDYPVDLSHWDANLGTFYPADRDTHNSPFCSGYDDAVLP